MSDYQKLNNYQSDSEESDEPPPSKKQKLVHEWKRTRTFKSIEEAKVHVKTTQKFVIKSTRPCSEGQKLYYDCKTNNCLSKVYLLKSNNTLDVDMYETVELHNHEGVKTVGIPMSTKLKIDLWFNGGITKPNQIVSHLREEEIDVPSKVQLNNYLRVIRKRMGPPILSIGQLCEFCDENEPIPMDSDQPYIIGKVIDAEQKTFQVIASTVRLLQNSSKSKVLHADATYKLVFEGFPVLVVGTSDKDRHFWV
ncbi:hypothetical protein Fcan01_28252 [Folsomia candida]|uniref:Uncharacterized protein n=1 Tax=Folsomia candida TaxID=158441 RepID=A0A226CVN7_FOLCA|nr:hypothetical protein Fcan01_28252 [Folsomia candida]